MSDGRPQWQMRLPNMLTFARLGIAAALFVLLSLPADPDAARPRLLLATALFIIAAATDALDGHLARRWNATSILGRIMDPFADKILILGSFILLAGPAFVDDAGRSISGVAPWMAVVILARELLVTTIRAAYESRGIDFSASWSGKAKMILQSIAVPLILIAAAWQTGQPDDSPLPHTLHLGALWTAWITTLVTTWSAIPYIQRAVRASTETPRS